MFIEKINSVKQSTRVFEFFLWKIKRKFEFQFHIKKMMKKNWLGFYWQAFWHFFLAGKFFNTQVILFPFFLIFFSYFQISSIISRQKFSFSTKKKQKKFAKVWFLKFFGLLTHFVKFPPKNLRFLEKFERNSKKKGSK